MKPEPLFWPSEPWSMCPRCFMGAHHFYGQRSQFGTGEIYQVVENVTPFIDLIKENALFVPEYVNFITRAKEKFIDCIIRECRNSECAHTWYEKLGEGF